MNVVDYITYVEPKAQILYNSTKRGKPFRNILTAKEDFMRNLSVPKKCRNFINTFSHPTNIVLKATAKKYNSEFLDESTPFASRWDLQYKKGDCTSSGSRI